MADTLLSKLAGQLVVQPTITDWFTTGLTFPTPSNLGAGSGTFSVAWMQDVYTLRLKLRFSKDATPGTGGTQVIFTMPTGYTIDTTKLNSLSDIGVAAFSGSVYGAMVDVRALSSTTFVVRKEGSGGQITGGDMTANSEINFYLDIPIVEFGLTAYKAYGVGGADDVTPGIVTVGTQVFSGNKTYLGSFTMGPVAGAVSHNIRGSLGFGVGSGSGLPAYGINRNASNGMDFYANSVIYGSYTSSGIWTFGNGTTGQHTIRGGGSAANGLAIVSQQTGDSAFANLVCTKAANDASGSQTFILFQINAGGANSGKITANGANAAQLASTSDERVKENIVSLTPQLDNILRLRPVEFDYIEIEGQTTAGHQIGFIAQEMDKVYPDSVVHEDDNNPYKSIVGWSKTEARLVSAIQEQNALIQSLLSRIENLEASNG